VLEEVSGRRKEILVAGPAEEAVVSAEAEEGGKEMGIRSTGVAVGVDRELVVATDGAAGVGKAKGLVATAGVAEGIGELEPGAEARRKENGVATGA
jgi:hypothetical protein